MRPKEWATIRHARRRLRNAYQPATQPLSPNYSLCMLPTIQSSIVQDPYHLHQTLPQNRHYHRHLRLWPVCCYSLSNDVIPYWRQVVSSPISEIRLMKPSGVRERCYFQSEFKKGFLELHTRIEEFTKWYAISCRFVGYHYGIPLGYEDLAW